MRNVGGIRLALGARRMDAHSAAAFVRLPLRCLCFYRREGLS
jgi:hypothetical protein